jgi:hypothetical protein
MNYQVRRGDDGREYTLTEWFGACVYSKEFLAFAYGHWDQGHPLGWARYCWAKEKQRGT